LWNWLPAVKIQRQCQGTDGRLVKVRIVVFVLFHNDQEKFLLVPYLLLFPLYILSQSSSITIYLLYTVWSHCNVRTAFHRHGLRYEWSMLRNGGLRVNSPVYISGRTRAMHTGIAQTYLTTTTLHNLGKSTNAVFW